MRAKTVEVMGGKTRLVSIMFNLKTEDNSVFVFNYDQAIVTSQPYPWADSPVFPPKAAANKAVHVGPPWGGAGGAATDNRFCLLMESLCVCLVLRSSRGP